MHAATVTPVARNDEPLDAALGPLHNDWAAEAKRYLVPATDPGVDFWTRWTAVRYICDDFQERYQRERALVDQLRPFILPAVADRLRFGGDQVFRLRLQLDRIGRRRGTGIEFAAGAQELLEHLAVWCTEIELAAHATACGALPAGAADLLAHLKAIGQLRR